MGRAAFVSMEAGTFRSIHHQISSFQTELPPEGVEGSEGNPQEIIGDFPTFMRRHVETTRAGAALATQPAPAAEVCPSARADSTGPIWGQPALPTALPPGAPMHLSPSGPTAGHAAPVPVSA